MGSQESIPGACSILGAGPECYEGEARRSRRAPCVDTWQCCERMREPYRGTERKIEPSMLDDLKPTGRILTAPDTPWGSSTVASSTSRYSDGASTSASAMSSPDRLLENNAAEWWRRSLENGVAVSLDGEPVFLTLDVELACLEVREHDQLYPLAALKTCEHLSRHPIDNVMSTEFELVVTFAEMDDLVFQFDEEEQRDSFALALTLLAEMSREGSIMGAPVHAAQSTASYVEVTSDSD